MPGESPAQQTGAGAGARVRLSPFLRGDSAQVLVLSALALVVLMGFLGLAIDVGQLRYAKRNLQAAADAAALAGALEVNSCGSVADCTALQTAAQTALVENGWTGSTLATQCSSAAATGLTLTVNNAPCALGSTAKDPNYGNANYVEVVVANSVPTYFMKVLGVSSVRVAARAEAAAATSPNCVYISATSGSDALELNGYVTLSSSCGIAVASASSQAIVVSSGSTLKASVIDVKGSYQDRGTISPTPQTGATIPADPLSWVPTPASSSCLKTNYTTSGSGRVTLNPGTYCGSTSLNSSGLVTFNAGTYTFTGSLTIQSPASGNGVTFYFSSGSLTINGSNTINLVAPTSGTYAGILIYQQSSDTTEAVINGSNDNVFQGAIYLPGAELLVNGGGNTAAYTILDCAKLLLNGSMTFTLGSDYSSLPNGSPLQGSSAAVAQ